jgi:ABC-type polysaccharide/polyol phosphate export permease
MYLNPMAGVIESARSVLTGSTIVSFENLAISLVASIILFFVGLLIFSRYERIFADII